ncbi:adenosine deaminase [Lacihabitans sp. LS3-19]|nr:adenosine deaminase [Lacihabitans sp. LS3-19]
MPKGGDLHHHFDGSLYAETFFENAIQNKLWLNTQTYILSKNPEKAKNKPGVWVQLSNIKSQDSLLFLQQKLSEKWSSKDFNILKGPSDDHFFSTFSGFEIVNNEDIGKGLLELKNRAQIENVQYIETILLQHYQSEKTESLEGFNLKLWNAQENKDEKLLTEILDEVYDNLLKSNLEKQAKEYNKKIEKTHLANRIDDDSFTLRYQNAVLRLKSPAQVFADLVLCFVSSSNSQLINGVNIVGQEDHRVAMSDYWLHMRMYRYLNSKFPNIQNSLHAGELTLGMVKPEELSWHIEEAIDVAGAKRIGHGIDIPFEKNGKAILEKMHNENIAIEINLTSNEFILKVKNDEHPISLYKKHSVPIVISTDDAGVLRTNLTEQYVLMAKRYPQFSYSDIKQIVFNSIQYSFIEDSTLKSRLMLELKNDFESFEKDHF